MSDQNSKRKQEFDANSNVVVSVCFLADSHLFLHGRVSVSSVLKKFFRSQFWPLETHLACLKKPFFFDETAEQWIWNESELEEHWMWARHFVQGNSAFPLGCFQWVKSGGRFCWGFYCPNNATDTELRLDELFFSSFKVTCSSYIDALLTNWSNIGN